jgi:sigma-B regulation protein RsbQ
MDVLTRSNVQVHGPADEQPMVFSHGFGCDQNMWRYVWPEFADEYRIVLFDHVGHGRSERSAFDPVRHATLDGTCATCWTSSTRSTSTTSSTSGTPSAR